MTYEQVFRLKRNMGFHPNGDKVIVTDQGFNYNFFVTPSLDSDFAAYIAAFDPIKFTDFSATSYSSNQRFRLRLISTDNNQKRFINIDPKNS